MKNQEMEAKKNCSKIVAEWSKIIMDEIKISLDHSKKSKGGVAYITPFPAECKNKGVRKSVEKNTKTIGKTLYLSGSNKKTGVKYAIDWFLVFLSEHVSTEAMGNYSALYDELDELGLAPAYLVMQDLTISNGWDLDGVEVEENWEEIGKIAELTMSEPELSNPKLDDTKPTETFSSEEVAKYAKNNSQAKAASKFGISPEKVKQLCAEYRKKS